MGGGEVGAVTKILPCRCTHQFQDREYGLGNRVHNSGDHQPNRWRCSVCKDVKTAKREIVQPKT
jgi:hypothetical protein